VKELQPKSPGNWRSSSCWPSLEKLLRIFKEKSTQNNHIGQTNQNDSAHYGAKYYSQQECRVQASPILLQQWQSTYEKQRSSCCAGVLEKHIMHLLLTLLLLLRDLLLWFCGILSVLCLTNLFYWTQGDSICTLLHQSFMKLQLPWEYIASGENTSHNFGISHFLFAKLDSNKV
jgi:hypothetical protein